jgi:hypothetical protein
MATLKVRDEKMRKNAPLRAKSAIEEVENSDTDKISRIAETMGW